MNVADLIIRVLLDFGGICFGIVFPATYGMALLFMWQYANRSV